MTDPNLPRGSEQRNKAPIDPGIAGSARQSPYPDAEVYNRPSTPRISPANIGLSIVVLVLVTLGVLALLLWMF